MNCIDWEREDKNTDKIHPTQKPVGLIKRLIEIFTDPEDVVIDPVAGSASTLVACAELKRSGYGFEIKKDFYKDAKKRVDMIVLRENEIDMYEFTKLQKEYFQTFFVFDQKGNQVDEFGICLKTDYEIFDEKEEE